MTTSAECDIEMYNRSEGTVTASVAQVVIIRDTCPNNMFPLNSNQVALRGQIMSYRNWHKYDFKVGNKIEHCGITTDLERC
jgi:hypothetical protein